MTLGIAPTVQDGKEGYPRTGRYKRVGGIPNAVVGPAQTPHDERAVVLHEVLHFAWDISGLQKRYSIPTEERIITTLEPWLLQVLRDNPDLVAYLTYSQSHKPGVHSRTGKGK